MKRELTATVMSLWVMMRYALTGFCNITLLIYAAVFLSIAMLCEYRRTMETFSVETVETEAEDIRWKGEKAA